MSNVGMSILLGANVLSRQKNEPLYIPTKEENLEVTHEVYEKKVTEIVNGETVTTIKQFPVIEIKHKPVLYPKKKTFIFIYGRKAV
mgnify:CR=1 FL=1